MADWRFYGRQRETDRLVRYIGNKGFAAYIVHGKRGVGKTHLLKEVGRRRKTDAPMLFYETPEDLSRYDSDGYALLEAVRNADAMHLLDGYDISAPVKGYLFRDMLHHLVQRGAIVVLDEFHNARKTLTEGNLKWVIDQHKLDKNVDERGKIIVMGSHQQKISMMLRGDQPLSGRFYPGANLKSWSIRTVAEMAEEHGFLQDPGKFLTLWTAYGGMPGNWERFATHDVFRNLRDFSAWPNDGNDWHMAFIETEKNWLRENPEDRYDWKAYVSLSRENRDILLWMARNAPRGCRENRFPQHIRMRKNPDFRTSVEQMSGRLELIAENREFAKENAKKLLQIKDPYIQFQIMALQNSAINMEMPVHPDSQSRQSFHEPRKPEDHAIKELAAMQVLEGHALERLAAETWECCEDVHYSKSRIWRQSDARNRPLREDPAEIDLYVQVYLGTGRRPVFGSCKRSAGKLSGPQLDADIKRFLSMMPEGKTADYMKTARHVLIAPSFTPDQRRRMERDGRECMDIQDMFREAFERKGSEPEHEPEDREPPGP